MKLTRQSTSELDRSDRENTFSGKVAAKYLLRGNKHHFLIENATPAELKAIDGLLSETGFATCCDSRQDYDKGCSRGWWIAVEDVPAFKAEYKRLKSEVAARIEANKAVAVDKALAEMSDEQVAILDRVAYNVRTDLLTEGSTVKSLRNTDYSTPAANPFNNARNPLTPELWELVEQCLIIGKNETCASLRILESKTGAEIRRRREAAQNAFDVDLAGALPGLSNLTETEIAELAEEDKPRRLAARTGFTVEQCRDELIAEEGNFLEARCNLLAIVAEAHDEALAINYVLDAMPDGAGSLNGYVVQHAEGTFHNVSERNRTHNPLQASYFSPHDHQQGRMKQFCMNGEKIVRLGDACRSVAGHAKSPVHQPHKKE